MTELQDKLAALGASPQDNGTLEMIVCRPQVEQRRVLDEAELDVTIGLVGDNWLERGSSSTEDGRAHPDAQITLMNSRVLQTVAQDRSRWELAGDQLIVDLDLTAENLPVGQRIAIGTAVLEITAKPHTGCAKFTARFGSDAIRFVNSGEGRDLRRRGVYAKVIQAGKIRTNDTIKKV
jgi:MOSC domain-containing protein YiiM